VSERYGFEPRSMLEAGVGPAAAARELCGLFFVCCLYSVDVKNLRREHIYR
jgi:hypothetical protein